MSESTGATPASPLVLVTGATGYVGARLVAALERDPLRWRVRCMARRPESLRERVGPATEIVAGDVRDRASLERALAGVSIAYYLVHAMEGRDFEQRDRAGAGLFAEAARRAGLRRIVYLGGLGDDAHGLSRHLRSRHEVGEILRASGVDTVELRASIVIGCGSLSFELVRALVERLPVMITPRWVATPCQPIAVSDLLRFLRGALDLPAGAGRIYEIGGPEQVSYGRLMGEYARQRGLRRLVIPVPVLTPYLSSLWLGLVTPYLARVGRKLVDSLRNPTVVSDPAAAQAFGFRTLGVEPAIAEALRDEDRERADTRWSALLRARRLDGSRAALRLGTCFIDSRIRDCAAPVEDAFAPVRRIGGAGGFYYANWLWALRMLLDRWLGGPRVTARRDPEHLVAGDRFGPWLVERCEPDRRLLLRAVMRLPGRAWLDFEVEPAGAGARVRQTAVFDARGLLGLLYWTFLVPLHHRVFGGMLRAIVARGETLASRAEEGAEPGGRVLPRSAE